MAHTPLMADRQKPLLPIDNLEAQIASRSLPKKTYLNMTRYSFKIGNGYLKNQSKAFGLDR